MATQCSSWGQKDSQQPALNLRARSPGVPDFICHDRHCLLSSLSIPRDFSDPPFIQAAYTWCPPTVCPPTVCPTVPQAPGVLGQPQEPRLPRAAEALPILPRFVLSMATGFESVPLAGFISGTDDGGPEISQSHSNNARPTGTHTHTCPVSCPESQVSIISPNLLQVVLQQVPSRTVPLR